ncbi:MAG: hypothetical protein RLO81_03090 [Fulvivirga sp.]|uniref:hypothetical protein n=1 Tax=Fulvivirga sp. TaxID=1931237 RepID=UPI0032ED638F
MNRLSSFILIAILFACESKKSSENVEEKTQLPLNKQLVGTWQNLALHVTMKRDSSDSVMVVPEGKWEEILKIKPIETTFREEGTYTSIYKSLSGQVMMTTEGTWSIDADTLMMTQNGITNSYHTTIEENVVTFKGVLDWDEDGENDDYYEGTQEKISTKEGI